MSNVGPIVPPPSASAVPSYSPLGKPVVGNENAQDKDRALAPLVQGEAAEKSRNRIEPKPDAQQRERQPGEQSASQKHEPEEPAAVPHNRSAPAIRVIPSGHAESLHGRAAVDAFQQGDATDPGQLLDQRV